MREKKVSVKIIVSRTYYSKYALLCVTDLRDVRGGVDILCN